eukprot:scaffold17478_cov76-Cylindrotheca_fusiformis.AAC.2
MGSDGRLHVMDDSASKGLRRRWSMMVGIVGRVILSCPSAGLAEKRLGSGCWFAVAKSWHDGVLEIQQEDLILGCFGGLLLSNYDTTKLRPLELTIRKIKKDPNKYLGRSRKSCVIRGQTSNVRGNGYVSEIKNRTEKPSNFSFLANENPSFVLPIKYFGRGALFAESGTDSWCQSSRSRRSTCRTQEETETKDEHEVEQQSELITLAALTVFAEQAILFCRINGGYIPRIVSTFLWPSPKVAEYLAAFRPIFFCVSLVVYACFRLLRKFRKRNESETKKQSDFIYYCRFIERIDLLMLANFDQSRRNSEFRKLHAYMVAGMVTAGDAY